MPPLLHQAHAQIKFEVPDHPNDHYLRALSWDMGCGALRTRVGRARVVSAAAGATRPREPNVTRGPLG